MSGGLKIRRRTACARLSIRRQYIKVSPWSVVPAQLRSTVRSYINSEQDKDREVALSYCKQYGLDYQEMRKIIIAEMVAEYDANEPARAKRRKAKS